LGLVPQLTKEAHRFEEITFHFGSNRRQMYQGTQRFEEITL
jgi:hypothetical protein